jgi:hypothetical protein
MFHTLLSLKGRLLLKYGPVQNPTYNTYRFLGAPHMNMCPKEVGPKFQQVSSLVMDKLKE